MTVNRDMIEEKEGFFYENAASALSLLEMGKQELQKEWPNVSILTCFLVGAEEQAFDLVISVPDERLKHFPSHCHSKR